MTTRGLTWKRSRPRWRWIRKRWISLPNWKRVVQVRLNVTRFKYHICLCYAGKMWQRVFYVLWLTWFWPFKFERMYFINLRAFTVTTIRLTLCAYVWSTFFVLLQNYFLILIKLNTSQVILASKLKSSRRITSYSNLTTIVKNQTCLRPILNWLWPLPHSSEEKVAGKQSFYTEFSVSVPALFTFFIHTGSQSETNTDKWAHLMPQWSIDQLLILTKKYG